MEISNKIENSRKKRDVEQSEINAALSLGEAKGLNKQGVKDALAYVSWSQKKKDAYLVTFRMTLEAHNINIQQDLFLGVKQ